jgi:hypothetical protein
MKDYHDPIVNVGDTVKLRPEGISSLPGITYNKVQLSIAHGNLKVLDSYPMRGSKHPNATILTLKKLECYRIPSILVDVIS